MSGKYTKQGVFPLILDGSEEVTGANQVWGIDTGKVGLIKLTGTVGFGFNGTTSPADNSGDSVYVVNTNESGDTNVLIVPDPFVDNKERVNLAAGEAALFTYHHDHGWLPMGHVTLT